MDREQNVGNPHMSRYSVMAKVTLWWRGQE